MKSDTAALEAALGKLFEMAGQLLPESIDRTVGLVNILAGHKDAGTETEIRFFASPGQSAHDKIARAKLHSEIEAAFVHFRKRLVSYLPALGCPFSNLSLNFFCKPQAPVVRVSLTYRGRAHVHRAGSPEEFTQGLAGLAGDFLGYRAGPTHFKVEGHDFTGASAMDALHAWAVNNRREFLDPDKVTELNPPFVCQVVDAGITKFALQARLLARAKNPELENRWIP